MSMPDQDSKDTAAPQCDSGVYRELVYRQVRNEEFPVETRQGAEFRLLEGAADARPLRAAMVRVFGRIGWLKVWVKLAALKRLLYVVIADGRIVNWGWIALSFCRHYRVEDGDVIIGPLETEEADRGKGYATWGVKHAINVMVRRRHRVFFINTAEINTDMQKVITACGFGEPVSSYLRGPGYTRLPSRGGRIP